MSIGKCNGIGFLVKKIDPDALAFINAAGITNAIQKIAINNLVKDLKNINNIIPNFVNFDNPANSLLVACYPLVGGTNNTHKYNLIDPRDLDAAYRLTYSGVLTHNSFGIKGSATGLSNTKLNPFVYGLNLNSHGLDIFITEQTAFPAVNYQFDIGASEAGGKQLQIGLSAPNLSVSLYNTSLGDNMNNAAYSKYPINSLGLWQLNKTSAALGDLMTYNNGKKVVTATTNVGGTMPNFEICFNGIGGGTAFNTTRTTGFAAIRNVGLDTVSEQLYTNAIIKFQQTLGRFTHKNLCLEGHSMLGFDIGAYHVDENVYGYTLVSCNGSFANSIADCTNSAIGGSLASQLLPRKNTGVDPFYRAGWKNNIVIWIGTNDITGSAAGQGTATFAFLNTYVNAVIASGWKPIVLTMIPWKVPAPQAAQFAIELAIYNNLIKNSLNAYTSIIDLDVHPELMNPLDGTYFQADGIHLLPAANTIIGSDIATVLNTL